MSSAVHVVGIKGVVFSLEGRKEKGDGYKSDFSMTGKSQVCRARMKPRMGGKEHPMMAQAPASRAEPERTLAPVSLSTNFHQKKKRLAGDHRTICREETM